MLKPLLILVLLASCSNQERSRTGNTSASEIDLSNDRADLGSGTTFEADAGDGFTFDGNFYKFDDIAQIITSEDCDVRTISSAGPGVILVNGRKINISDITNIILKSASAAGGSNSAATVGNVDAGGADASGGGGGAGGFGGGIFGSSGGGPRSGYAGMLNTTGCPEKASSFAPGQGYTNLFVPFADITLCLEVTADLAKVYAKPCSFTKVCDDGATLPQKFVLDVTGTLDEAHFKDATMMIKPKLDPSKCVDIADGRYSDDDSVILYKCHGGDNQKFKLSQHNNLLFLTPLKAFDTRCFAKTGSGLVLLKNCSFNDANQQFMKFWR